MSSSPLREGVLDSRCPSGHIRTTTHPGGRGPALLVDTLRAGRLSAVLWVVGGGGANIAMAIALKREMGSFPGGAAGLAASILPAAEVMRPLRWPAERIDTLGGYLTYHNLTLFTLFLAIYGAMQGARAIRGGEDSHSLEEILATAWSRWDVVRDRAVGFALTMVVISLGLGLATAGGMAAAEEPNLSGALAAFAAIGACALVGYGLGLLVSQFTVAHRAAAGVAAVVLTCLYVVENTWENLHGLEFLRFISPFHYANLSRALVPGRHFDAVASAMLLGVAAVLVVASGWAFQQRDYGAPLWQRRGRLRRADASASNRTVGDVTETVSTGPVTGRLTHWLLRSAWSALVLRGRYGLLAWTAAAAMFAGLMMFLEPPVMDVWSWFATFVPGGGEMTGASAETRYVSFTTQIVVPFIAGYVVTQASGWTTDLSQGRVELALATRLSRRRLVAERLLSVVVGAAFVAIGGILGTGVGAAAVGVPLHPAGLVRTAADCLLLGAALGGVAVLVVAVLRGSLAVTLLAVLLGASYLVGYLVELLTWPAWTARLSVFSLFGSPYVGWPAAIDLAVMAGLAVIGGALAMLVAEMASGVG